MDTNESRGRHGAFPLLNMQKQERLYREPRPFRERIKIMDLSDQKLP